MLHQKSEQSKQLALSLQNSLNQLYGVYHKVPYYGRTYYILNHSTVPTVILEIGFITNVSDRQMLLVPAKLQLLAKAIGDGVIDYLRNTS